METAGTPFCSRRASNRTRFVLGQLNLGGVFDQENAVRPAGMNFPSAVKKRGFAGTCSAADKQVAPLRGCSLPSDLREPGRGSRFAIRSSISKCRELNLRMVSVTPFRLHGGITAATRLPSGKPRVENGLRFRDIVAQTPRDIFHGDGQRALADRNAAELARRKPSRSMNTRSGPLTMTSLTESSRMRCSMGFRNGSMVSNPCIRVLLRRVAGSRICSGRCSRASDSKTTEEWDSGRRRRW